MDEHDYSVAGPQLKPFGSARQIEPVFNFVRPVELIDDLYCARKKGKRKKGARGGSKERDK